MVRSLSGVDVGVSPFHTLHFLCLLSFLSMLVATHHFRGPVVLTALLLPHSLKLLKCRYVQAAHRGLFLSGVDWAELVQMGSVV